MDHVDRILRNAKLTDLPVQAPTKYELAFNPRKHSDWPLHHRRSPSPSVTYVTPIPWLAHREAGGLSRSILHKTGQMAGASSSGLSRPTLSVGMGDLINETRGLVRSPRSPATLLPNAI